VLFECLAGRAPYTARGLAEMTYSILHDAPPAVSALRPDLPWAIAEIVEKCLHRQARDRYASALVLRDALLTAAQ
jgi:serine/threonine protein kinase